MEEFFEEQARKPPRVVPNDAVFLEEIIQDNAEAELLKHREIDHDGFSTLRAVAPSHSGRDGLAVCDDPIDYPVRHVLLDRAEMISKSVACGLTGLRHQVGDVNARSLGFGYGARDFRDHKIREDAGIERARSEKDEVCLPDGFNRLGERPHAAWR